MKDLEPINPNSFNDKRFSLSKSSEEPTYIAAIDIGTNSTHLLLALINPLLNTFTIEIAEKSTTRLGERDPDSGELTVEAMQRVMETLKHFKEIASSYKVQEILTAATSAVREAPNGKEFLGNVYEELGIDVELITGTEEARLIYLGVLSGMQFNNTPHIIIDIGGGSTELILADSNDARALTSTKIGAVRLQREFIKSEPMSLNKVKFLKAYIQGSLEQAVEKIKGRIGINEIPSLVATSGTAMAIGTLISEEESMKNIKLQGYKFSKNKVDKLVDRLIALTPEQRKKINSLNDRRAEIIVPGALILQTSMKLLGSECLTLSERALREGLIVDWMIRHGFLEDRFAYQKNIRKKTVIHQVERFSVDRQRAESVAKNAMSFYDATKGFLHTDNGTGRELLWAAAMLHSCGKHINRSAYHKHSWYLIRNGELLGYSQSEHQMISAIARYHRRSLPKKRHEAWQIISTRSNKKIVMEMSLILRLASSIDRRPEPAVQSLVIQASGLEVKCQLIPKNEFQDLSLEKWSLNNCRSIVKENTGIELVVMNN